MRSDGSIKSSSLALVVAALLSGCSAADPPQDVIERDPVVPAPVPAPNPPREPSSADVLREVEQVRSSANPERPLDEVIPQPVRRLYFQCTDKVSFAVRMDGSRLDVYPPGFTLGYIILAQQPTDSGLLYTRRGAEFRTNANAQLATLTLGDDRYVDCVSNPAGAVWEPVRRSGTVY